MKSLGAVIAGVFLVAGPVVAADSVYEFTLNRIDGSPQELSVYKGKVLLIVNTASKCGFTPQYAGLQALYEKYKDRELVVLGFPANNFLGQEPGTNEEIEQFCSLKYNVTFPMFEKISVKGGNIHPLYAWLTAHPNGASVSWNFNKFLIGRNGQVMAHFGSRTAPDSEELTAMIEKALAQP